MKITFSVWLSFTVCALGLTVASPIGKVFQVTGKDSTESQTVSPLLLALTLSEDHVSLLPQKPSRSDNNIRTTTFPHSAVSGTRTSEETNNSHFRGVRSATSKETQTPDETTVGPITEETTAKSVKEESTVVPVDEITTSSVVTGETTAPVEVVLDREYLDNASRTVKAVLAKVENQIIELGYPYGAVDVLSRPMLPSDIRENAQQCVQIQPMLKAMHELLNDFMSHLEGLTTLNGDTTVKYAVRALDWSIFNLISPLYSYTPTVAPGTNVKNSEEVMCTLKTLQTQCEIIGHVLLDLKNC
ncbi:uncharacterized protein LOC123536785 [Mercenaria mercenaria]|uniref:uncharacterized protein LOC123536785 n=1 Tax=Mercenaria mercenaria TaxID=6596 RepID=UPI00234ED79E|nr:uncharacterized protein LOC123536785 [Mercenaria mercenaria]